MEPQASFIVEEGATDWDWDNVRGTGPATAGSEDGRGHEPRAVGGQETDSPPRATSRRGQPCQHLDLPK